MTLISTPSKQCFLIRPNTYAQWNIKKKKTFEFLLATKKDSEVLKSI